MSFIQKATAIATLLSLVGGSAVFASYASDSATLIDDTMTEITTVLFDALGDILLLVGALIGIFFAVTQIRKRVNRGK